METIKKLLKNRVVEITTDGKSNKYGVFHTRRVRAIISATVAEKIYEYNIKDIVTYIEDKVKKYFTGNKEEKSLVMSDIRKVLSKLVLTDPHSVLLIYLRIPRKQGELLKLFEGVLQVYKLSRDEWEQAVDEVKTKEEIK